jgi:hypothetical protein
MTMTNLSGAITDAELDLVTGGAEFEFHFSLFGYFFAMQGNDKMTNTLVVGPGHNVLVNNATFKG